MKRFLCILLLTLSCLPLTFAAEDDDIYDDYEYDLCD